MQTQRALALQIGPLVLCIAASLFSTLSRAEIPPGVSDMLVEETEGAVKVRNHEKWRSPINGMIFGLPAVVSTGEDGSIRMRQGETSISMASSTALEFFAGPETGSPVQRVVQDLGSAFYDIAPRESNKMRVETPYLVAVVKGTGFDVTIADETTSISLFEGQLQVEALDISDVVQLSAGQIARRHRDDARITVIDMSDGQVVARNDVRRESASGSGTDRGGTVAGSIDGSGEIVDVTANIPLGGGGLEIGGDIDAGSIGIDVNLAAQVETGALELGGGVSTAVMGSELNIDIAVGADVTAGSVVAGVDLDTVAGTADADLDIDAAAGTVDTDLDLDTVAGTVDTELDLDAAAGTVDTDLDLDTVAGTVDTDVDIDLDLETGSVDVDLDLETDLEETIEEIDSPLEEVEDLIPDPGDLLPGLPGL